MATRRKQDKNNLLSSMLHKADEDLKDEKHRFLDGDGGNIFLLFFLYTLQGIPLGLAYAIPMILQNRGVSYRQQVSVLHKIFFP